MNRQAIIDLFVFTLIAALFSLAVYKIDHAAIERVAKAQAVAEAARAKAAQACRTDIERINATHESVRRQATIQIENTRATIKAIRFALDNDVVPASLQPLYKRSLLREHSLVKKEEALRSNVHDLEPLC